MRAIYPTETYPHRINEGASSTGSFIAPVLYSDEEAAAMQAPHGSRAAQQGMGGMENYAISSDIPTGFKETQDYFDAVADLDNFVKEMYYKGYKPGEVDIRNPDTLKANQMLSQKLNGVKAIETRLKSLKNVWEDQLKRDKLTQRLPIDPNTGMPILGNSNEYFQTDFVPENTIQESSNRAFGGKQYYGNEYNQALAAVAQNRQALQDYKRNLVSQGYDPQTVDRMFNETFQQPIRQEVMPTARQVYGGGYPSGGGQNEGYASINIEAPEPVPIFTKAQTVRENGKVVKRPVEVSTRYGISVGTQAPITTNLKNFIAISDKDVDMPVNKDVGEVSFSNLAVVPMYKNANNGKWVATSQDRYDAMRRNGVNPSKLKYDVIAVGSFSDQAKKLGSEGLAKATTKIGGYMPLDETIERSLASAGGTKQERAYTQQYIQALKQKAHELTNENFVEAKGSPKAKTGLSNDDIFQTYFKRK